MGKVRRGHLFVAGVLAAISALSAWAGYFVMFSHFMPYDDEGYVMITLRSFMRGFPLYDSVYTQYGPSYYFLRALVYPIVGGSHDRGRLFSLVIWVLIALLVALYTYGVTRSVALAALAQVISFRLLSVITNEPGHPQELCGLLLVLALLLPLNSEGWALLGVLAGVLVLMKVNVGGLLIISVALLFPRRLRIAPLVVAALLPLVLMRHNLKVAWGFEYIVIATLSIAAVCIVILRRKDLPEIPLRDACIFTGALVTTAVAISGATLWRGSSLRGMFYGLVGQNLTFDLRAQLPLTLKTGAIPAALVAFVLSLVLLRSSKAVAVLKIGFCAVVVFLAIKGAGISLLGLGRGDLLILFAAPYLWLGMVSGGMRRVLVCCIATMQILQAYPMAGSQTAFGTFLMVPIALTGVVEGLRELAPESVWAWPKYRVAALTAVLLLLAVSLDAGWGLVYRRVYASSVPLNLPGAERLRLPAAQATALATLARTLPASCDGFISEPGVNSLYFWTNMEAPTQLNATGWWILLSEEQQREIIRQFSHYSRACVVVDDNRQPEDWNRSALAFYIAHDFHEVQRFDNYELRMRNDSVKTVASEDGAVRASSIH